MEDAKIYIQQMGRSRGRFDYYRRLVEEQIANAYGVPYYMVKTPAVGFTTLLGHSFNNNLNTNKMQGQALKTKRKEIEAHLNSLTKQRGEASKTISSAQWQKADFQKRQHEKISKLTLEIHAETDKFSGQCQAVIDERNLEIIALDNEIAAAKQTLAAIGNELLRD